MSGLQAQIETDYNILHLRHVGLHMFNLGFTGCALEPIELSHGNVQELGEQVSEIVGLAQRMTQAGRRVRIILALNSIPATLTVAPLGKKSWECYLSLYAGDGSDRRYVRGIHLGRLKSAKEFSDACFVLASEVAR